MDAPNYILSSLILIFFAINIVLYNSLKHTIALIGSAIFSYKANLIIDERVVSIRERNILALLSTFAVIIFITPILCNFYNLEYTKTLLYVILGLTIFSIFKRLSYSYIKWLSNNNSLFNSIESLFLNHFIIATFLSILLSIEFLSINFFGVNTTFKILIFCNISIFILFISRSLITFISHHFSLLFYILYLCILEIIPIALLIKIFLGHI